MIHYYVAPATREVVEYLRNGGREFYTHKEIRTQSLNVHFLASDEYIEKMKARPFLKNIPINRKA